MNCKKGDFAYTRTSGSPPAGAFTGFGHLGGLFVEVGEPYHDATIPAWYVTGKFFPAGYPLSRLAPGEYIRPGEWCLVWPDAWLRPIRGDESPEEMARPIEFSV